MNKRYMEKVAFICEQLQDNVTNYTLESQLATLVNYQCFDCDLFRKNKGKCYGKSHNKPCLYR